MTKKHFIHMASIIRAILEGHWTFDPPRWANRLDTDQTLLYDASHAQYDEESERSACYTRAVWTAEAFIKIAGEANPHFDTQRFLQACGLVAKPAKGKKR